MANLAYLVKYEDIESYQDIHALVQHFSDSIQQILGSNLIGLNLFGSLVYGDFNEGSSDIDLVAVVNTRLNRIELEEVKQLHQEIASNYKKWGEWMECSYLPFKMLSSILPPKELRPYYNAGIFYEEAGYGNEWIINNYLLIHHSIPLIGPLLKICANPLALLKYKRPA